MENTKETMDTLHENPVSLRDSVQDSENIGETVNEGSVSAFDDTKELTNGEGIERLKEEAAVAATARTAGMEEAVAPLPVYLPRKRSKAGLLFYGFFKRAFDIVASTLVLIILSPLILVCLFVKWAEDVKYPCYELKIEQTDGIMPAAKGVTRIVRKDGAIFDCTLIPLKKEKGVKYSSKPIYTSTRVGKGGNTFELFKIRSMVPNAEEMKDQLIAAGLNEADGPAFKMKDDPRITKFGKFLRKTSCDELPQLLNIIRGDMSVVGPRPPLPKEVEQYNEYQMHRLDVKGGLLCLWQIQKNRNALPFDEWVQLDLEYIDNRSLWLDLKIIFKGAYMVLFDRSGE